MWRVMMRLIHVAVAVLCLLSAGQSAPVTSCEKLIQRIEIQGRDQLLGKWTLIGESTNIKGSTLLMKKFLESSWAKVTAANESDAMNVYQAQKMFGSCFAITAEMKLKNSTLYLAQPINAIEVLLHTGCPDCLVVHSTYTIGESTYTGVQLLSRRNKVNDAELQEFLKQIECLGLLQPAILDPEKGSCPDESPSQKTETIDLNSFMPDSDTDVVQLFETIFSSQGGMEGLLEMISSSIANLREN